MEWGWSLGLGRSQVVLTCSFRLAGYLRAENLFFFQASRAAPKGKTWGICGKFLWMPIFPKAPRGLKQKRFLLLDSGE